MKNIKWFLSLLVLLVCFSFGSATSVYAKQVDGCVEIACPTGQKFDHKLCACVLKQNGCTKTSCPSGQKFDHKSCACVIKH